MVNKEEILVECTGVSKKFCKDFKLSLLYGLQDVLGSIVSNSDSHHSRLRKSEFWALRDINFTLKRGECLGLIGHNGAGKSTLLKILNGLINPDEGQIVMRGRVGALIELGAGFNPILTGRENIYNNGAVLGFTREEIEARLDKIIEFSEIGDFIDTPVQNYSSGMKVRLGFAVAVQMEPDILIIDEVLAVGDLGFTIKCLNRISELLSRCCVIFVSHAMPMVGKICSRAILLHRGKVEQSSYDTNLVIQEYFTRFSNEKGTVISYEDTVLNDFAIAGAVEGGEDYLSKKGDLLSFRFHFSSQSKSPLFVGFVINDLTLRSVAVFNSIEEGLAISAVDGEVKGTAQVVNSFASGKYTVTFDVHEMNQHLLGKRLLSAVSIVEFVSSGSKVATYCPVQLQSSWQILSR